ncbi:MAG: pirin family protein [Bacteroidetes bacterium]|nr:pirin family protein [Bacteroidota bacterium]
MSNRRTFLGKLSLGLTGLVALPSLAYGRSKKEDKTMSSAKEPIKKIKPMGFQWETQDPFLFCVHHEDKFPKGNEQMGPDTSYLKGRFLGDDFIIKDGFRMYHGKTVPGFPGHPHRGFETITVVREGLVDHADSMGAAGRYGNGDVQWMTAGKGVQHSEMFPLIHADKENPMELFQIWLNLPAKNKMVEPHFKMMWSEDIPHLTQKDQSGKKAEIEIIAGSLGNLQAASAPPDSWAANTANQVAVWNITLEANGKWILPKTEAGVNRTLYFYQGESITIAGKQISGYHAVEVEPDMDLEVENGNWESRILILQGKPIGENVIQYGPFVMNTKEEIQQAFDDYHATQFGGWPWPSYAQVHDRSKGRFAKHADGTLEEKK